MLSNVPLEMPLSRTSPASSFLPRFLEGYFGHWDVLRLGLHDHVFFLLRIQEQLTTFYLQVVRQYPIELLQDQQRG